MNFWWKVGLIALAVITVFDAGYFLKGKFEEANQAQLLREQIKTTREEQERVNGRATRAEKDLLLERQKYASLAKKWSVIRDAENHSVCLLDADTLSLLRDAAKPAGIPAR